MSFPERDLKINNFKSSVTIYVVTVKVVWAKLRSLVPTLTVNTPGSVTHLFWIFQSPSEVDNIGIVTVTDLPGLEECNVRSDVKLKSDRYAHLIYTFWNPTNTWLGVTTEESTSVAYTYAPNISESLNLVQYKGGPEPLPFLPQTLYWTQ